MEAALAKAAEEGVADIGWALEAEGVGTLQEFLRRMPDGVMRLRLGDEEADASALLTVPILNAQAIRACRPCTEDGTSHETCFAKATMYGYRMDIFQVAPEAQCVEKNRWALRFATAQLALTKSEALAITAIGDWAFFGCTSLSELALPAGVTRVGQRAFHECKSLRALFLPETLTKVCLNAFLGCTSLTEVTLPKSVAQVGAQAFMGCKALTTVRCEGPTSLGNMAFKSCSSLTTLVMVDGVEVIGGETFKGCISLPSYKGRAGLKRIKIGAFENCAALAAFTLPEGLEAIDANAFKKSSVLQATLPASLQRLGTYAFGMCTRLETVDVASTKLRKIASHTFKGCSGLMTAALPESLLSVESHAFAGCKALTTVTQAGGILTTVATCVLGGRAPEVGVRCTPMLQRVLPAGLSHLGKHAFDGCAALCDVSLSSLSRGLAAVDTHAFSGCTSLASLKVDGIGGIAKDAFAGCTALRTLVLPDGPKSIDDCEPT